MEKNMKNLMTRFPEFEQLFDVFNTPFTQQNYLQSLKSDYFIENNELKINVDVPGSSPEDVHVEYNKNTHSIIVKVNKQYEKKETKLSFYRRERCLSEQTRSFNLPSDVDTSTIKADIKNGLLSVSAKFIEKTPEEHSVTIKVSG
jgi:HSP20 family protein